MPGKHHTQTCGDNCEAENHLHEQPPIDFHQHVISLSDEVLGSASACTQGLIWIGLRTFCTDREDSLLTGPFDLFVLLLSYVKAGGTALQTERLCACRPFMIPIKCVGFRLAAPMQRERESPANAVVASQRMGHTARDPISWLTPMMLTLSLAVVQKLWLVNPIGPIASLRQHRSYVDLDHHMGPGKLGHVQQRGRGDRSIAKGFPAAL
jgi:hypothetical protein